MVSTFKLLAVLQLALTTLATSATLVPRQASQAKQARPLRNTNNNTWIIAGAEFDHAGPALKRKADNVGGIRFYLRRSVWQKNMDARTMTFVPVAEDKAVSCSYGNLDPVTKSKWRQCSGYSSDDTPPGDDSMTDELNRRLRFRLSNLRTSPTGNFEGVTMEIVNHVVPRKYMHGDVSNAPGAWDRVPMVIVYSTKVVYEPSAAKCSLRALDYTVGKGWEQCSFGARTSLVQEETITSVAFEQKYWKLGETSPRSECS